MSLGQPDPNSSRNEPRFTGTTTTKIRFTTRVGPIAKRARTVHTPESDVRADEILELRRRVLAIEQADAGIDKKSAILGIAIETPDILDNLHVGYTSASTTGYAAPPRGRWVVSEAATHGEPLHVAGIILLYAVKLADGPIVKNFIRRVLVQFQKWEQEGLPNGLVYNYQLRRYIQFTDHSEKAIKRRAEYPEYQRKIHGKFSLDRFLMEDVGERLAEVALVRGDPAVIDAVLSFESILNQEYSENSIGARNDDPREPFKGTLLHVYASRYYNMNQAYEDKDVSKEVKLLLKYGINLTKTNYEGKTAFQCFLEKQKNAADQLEFCKRELKEYTEQFQQQIATLQAQLNTTGVDSDLYNSLEADIQDKIEEEQQELQELTELYQEEIDKWRSNIALCRNIARLIFRHYESQKKTQVVVDEALNVLYSQEDDLPDRLPHHVLERIQAFAGDQSIELKDLE